MKRSFGSTAFLGLLCISCLTGFAGSLPENDLTPTLTVLLYDYCGVPELTQMETQARRILSKAGIRSRWLTCRVPDTKPSSHPDCERPQVPTSIVLRIVKGGLATRKRFGFTGLGYSAVREGGGHLATVIMSRAWQVHQEGSASLSEILGHAAAHEIGHLLLNSTSHSLAGIMQAHWDREDLHKMAAGSLLFTNQESKLMRKNMTRRSKRTVIPGSPAAQARGIH